MGGGDSEGANYVMVQTVQTRAGWREVNKRALNPILNPHSSILNPQSSVSSLLLDLRCAYRGFMWNSPSAWERRNSRQGDRRK